MSDELREQLAAYAHEALAGWTAYMLDSRRGYPDKYGGWVINSELYQQWVRQMSTPYAELQEFEKESDRAEADKILSMMRSDLIIFEGKILDIISEFGDQPEQCLQIISEHIQLRQHYRARPNAPKVEEPT